MKKAQKKTKRKHEKKKHRRENGKTGASGKKFLARAWALWAGNARRQRARAS
jgi:hypothetical protein